MQERIQSMLIKAYDDLGVKDADKQERLIGQAMNYLKKDRERYVEIAESGTPEYMISTQMGVICHLIPLALDFQTEKKERYKIKKTCVLALMVTEKDARYVQLRSQDLLYPDPADSVFGYPVCYFTHLKNVDPGLRALPPEAIIPLATPRDRDIFGMIFVAIAKFSKDLPLNCIPHKTERAMMILPHARQTQIILNGQTVDCKLIPLARERSMWDEMREDHRCSYEKELCLMITEDTLCYVLKVLYVYHYFRKVIYDDAPGGCAYEPTQQKRETTYQAVALENIQEKMYPLYD